ncbi:MAG: hypothetical protein MUO30_05600 [Anaerolineales bacterium]|nr:hypothetical protein [Anaerolineales bacterium]
MSSQIVIGVEQLESIIRRVVREELAQILVKEPDTFYIAPDSPLYKDMQEILHRREQGTGKLHTHAEVWGE